MYRVVSCRNDGLPTWVIAAKPHINHQCRSNIKVMEASQLLIAHICNFYINFPIQKSALKKKNLPTIFVSDVYDLPLKSLAFYTRNFLLLAVCTIHFTSDGAVEHIAHDLALRVGLYGFCSGPRVFSVPRLLFEEASKILPVNPSFRRLIVWVARARKEVEKERRRWRDPSEQNKKRKKKIKKKKLKNVLRGSEAREHENPFFANRYLVSGIYATMRKPFCLAESCRLEHESVETRAVASEELLLATSICRNSFRIVLCPGRADNRCCYCFSPWLPWAHTSQWPLLPHLREWERQSDHRATRNRKI